MLTNKTDREEKKKKQHSLLDKYNDDVAALEDAAGADAFEYLFAKPYLDEVLGERRGKRENENTYKLSKEAESKRLMERAKRNVENMSAEDWAEYKREMSLSQKIVDKALGGLPEYQALLKAKAEMDDAGLINGDNYYHRLGMCNIGQLEGISETRKRNVSKMLGGLKEANDFYKKVIAKIPRNPQALKEMRDNPIEMLAFILHSTGDIYDSKKDMQNNKEGLNYGLNNLDKSCREWLEDLDYKNNKWKNRR